ncbi:hypothetical protein J8J14_10670 [Roseomonas sp. SSH11]|uniref:Uncharacterized protein n=1 Tax=Pararoseomonas baculiformis TaxID=2820812 RepID=A0ABS4AE12_9PROT|nr:hypothetical protein [Pararoseomonas baculiformis]MBP0445243.1 hypothetical protein [Pararoseomonas baculiformis]
MSFVVDEWNQASIATDEAAVGGVERYQPWLCTCAIAGLSTMLWTLIYLAHLSLQA